MLSVFKKDAITVRATREVDCKSAMSQRGYFCGGSVRAFGKTDGRQVTAGLDNLPKDD